MDHSDIHKKFNWFYHSWSIPRNIEKIFWSTGGLDVWPGGAQWKMCSDQSI